MVDINKGESKRTSSLGAKRWRNTFKADVATYLIWSSRHYSWGFLPVLAEAAFSNVIGKCRRLVASHTRHMLQSYNSVYFHLFHERGAAEQTLAMALTHRTEMKATEGDEYCWLWVSNRFINSVDRGRRKNTISTVTIPIFLWP